MVLFGGGRVAITGPTEYCLDVLNRNNPLRIEVLPKDVDITYKTLTNSIIVSRLVKDRNKFFVYFNEEGDKNIMQSRLLNMLMSQGIIPTLFAREANNNIDFKAIDNIAGGIIYEI